MTALSEERYRFVETSFSKQSAMKTLGITLSTIQQGYVEMRLGYAEHILQQQGFIHGGVITAGLDSACGFSALTLAPENHEVLSIEFKTSFLRPASAPLFLFRGQVLKAGRRICFTEASAFAVQDGREILIAKMSSSVAVVALETDKPIAS